MRYWFCLLFVSCLMLSNSYAQKVAGNDLKVGFVNIRKLMTQAPQLEQIQKQLADDFKEKNDKIIALRHKIAQLSAKYDENTDKTTLIALQNQITEQQRELAKQQQIMQDEYNVRRNEALGKLQTLIVRMVAKVSREKQMDIVLNNTGVIYVSSRIDITPDVFAHLSEESIE